MPFLERVPKYFQCKLNGSTVWNSCSKDNICSGDPKDKYKAVSDTSLDSDYINNWVE
jgi:hypothetical protein